jgi:4a-hydroxytetrahydrobiopterin dehydratase
VSASQELIRKRCQPCEGGIPPLPAEQVAAYLVDLPGWQLTADGRRIRRAWRVRDFLAGLDFFNRIAQLAEDEGHHPDLHLTNYRDVVVESTTHAVQGLTENDFILASKIDRLPVATKSNPGEH